MKHAILSLLLVFCFTCAPVTKNTQNTNDWTEPFPAFRIAGNLYYVGTKGVMFTGCYGDQARIIPAAKMQETPAPPKTLPRPKSIFVDFVEACLSGRTDTAVNFDYGARLTEFALLGNLAQHAGEGRKVEWDGPNIKVTNNPELNQWVKRPYRKGWEV